MYTWYSNRYILCPFISTFKQIQWSICVISFTLRTNRIFDVYLSYGSVAGLNLEKPLSFFCCFSNKVYVYVHIHLCTDEIEFEVGTDSRTSKLIARRLVKLPAGTVSFESISEERLLGKVDCEPRVVSSGSSSGGAEGGGKGGRVSCVMCVCVCGEILCVLVALSVL